MSTLTEQKQKVKALFKKSPLIISGPCSAETEEQVLEGARRLAATGKVDIMRAGIWKPRTDPVVLKVLVPKVCHGYKLLKKKLDCLLLLR